jgi:hypothetical protein
MRGDRRVTLVPIAEPRPLSPEEQALIEFLLDHPLGRPELREQARTAQVVSSCSCGCPSVGLAVEPSAPRAVFRAEEMPIEGTDWLPFTAFQRSSNGETEVTLHIVDGRLHELEIWGGSYGVRPALELERLVRDDA